VLPKSHPVVSQLIRYEHLSNGHAGVQFLMSHLRQKVWIIQSRQAIRRVIYQCKACRRHSAKNLQVEPAALPPNRVQNSAPFQVTGIDLAGPLYLKGKKAWIILFTCAVYRCVHLDCFIPQHRSISGCAPSIHLLSRPTMEAIFWGQSVLSEERICCSANTMDI